MTSHIIVSHSTVKNTIQADKSRDQVVLCGKNCSCQRKPYTKTIKWIFMKTNEKTSEVLNDLIQINNDRVEGYEKAANETDIKDVDLRSLFSEFASDSRRYANELAKYVVTEPAVGTTVRGKIYRVWMDVKAT